MEYTPSNSLKMWFTLLHVLVFVTRFSSVITDSHEETYDVLILGGGMAGVSAARTLQSHGVTKFLIIEGRSEIGGRTQAGQVGDYVVEGGSLWIQEASDENPLYNEALKYNLTLTASDYDDWIVYDEAGNDITEDADVAYEDLLETLDKAENFLTQRTSHHPDISIRSALHMFGFNPQTPVEQACDFFEFDHELGQRPDISSLSNMGTSTDREDFLVLEKENSAGYVRVTQSMLEEGVPDWRNKTHFDTTVQYINYTHNEVIVGTNKGIFRGKKAVVTFSLGVLQNHAIKFHPEFPVWKEEAIQSFQISDYLHFYMKFPSNMTWFVPNNTEWVGFASSRRGFYPFWQNFNKFWPGSHIIQGTLLDQEGRRVDLLSDAEIQSEAMSVLRMIFGSDIPDPEDFYQHKFISDPFFYGGFTNWPVGYTQSQYDALTAHIHPVFFAGEAYDEEDYGYLHGALKSGERVARKVAECIQDSSQCPHTYVPPYEARGCTYKMASNYDSSAQLDDGSCFVLARSPIGYKTSSSQRPTFSFIMYFLVLLKFL